MSASTNAITWRYYYRPRAAELYFGAEYPHILAIYRGPELDSVFGWENIDAMMLFLTKEADPSFLHLQS